MLNLSQRVSAEQLRQVEVEDSADYPAASSDPISLLKEKPPKAE
jgi:hypothetical protein